MGFADLTKDEFKAQYTGLRMDLAQKKRLFEKSKKALEMDLTSVELPSSYDCRSQGAVNPIKDQAQCGSCWAFGTVANIEGAYVVQGKGELKSLSEQELVSCDTSDSGCNGGLPDRAYEWMIDSKSGLELESAYPYTSGTGNSGTCRKVASQEKVFINGYKDISTDEDQIAAALMQYGPLAIGINAEPMQLYFGGIDDPADCDPQELDHAVNIVGFGEKDGKKYWIIRNSWGKMWGEDGYYRIVRGVGRCGLNQMVSTAIFNS